MVIRSKALDADLRRLAPQSGENLGYLGRSFQLHWARASHSAGLAAGGDIAAVNITPSIVFTISLASREKSKWKSFVVTISGMRCFALLAATVLLLRTVQPFDRTRSLSLSLSLSALPRSPPHNILPPSRQACKSQPSPRQLPPIGALDTRTPIRPSRQYFDFELRTRLAAQLQTLLIVANNLSFPSPAPGPALALISP